MDDAGNVTDHRPAQGHVRRAAASTSTRPRSRRPPGTPPSARWRWWACLTSEWAKWAGLRGARPRRRRGDRRGSSRLGQRADGQLQGAPRVKGSMPCRSTPAARCSNANSEQCADRRPRRSVHRAVKRTYQERTQTKEKERKGDMRGIVYTGEDAEVTDKLRSPTRPTEVKVTIVAAGVCHSDLSVHRRDHPLEGAFGPRPRRGRHRRGGGLRGPLGQARRPRGHRHAGELRDVPGLQHRAPHHVHQEPRQRLHALHLRRASRPRTSPPPRSSPSTPSSRRSRPSRSPRTSPSPRPASSAAASSPASARSSTGPRCSPARRRRCSASGEWA